jgi:hypothetical protein
MRNCLVTSNLWTAWVCTVNIDLRACSHGPDITHTINHRAASTCEGGVVEWGGLRLGTEEDRAVAPRGSALRKQAGHHGTVGLQLPPPFSLPMAGGSSFPGVQYLLMISK